MGVNKVHNLNYGNTSAKQPQSPGETQNTGIAFKELLKGRASENLNFSKHAAKRLDERGIQLDSRLLGDLEQAVEEARKGAFPLEDLHEMLDVLYRGEDL